MAITKAKTDELIGSLLTAIVSQEVKRDAALREVVERWGETIEARTITPEQVGRAINRIFIHCTATPEGRPVGVNEIRRWHIEERGWDDIGYHWIVLLDGSVEAGRPEAQAGAHAQGHNHDSIGIAYVGGTGGDGKAKDTRTMKQVEGLDRLVDEIRARYGQHIEVWGHNEVSSKDCPSYDVAEDRKNRRR